MWGTSRAQSDRALFGQVLALIEAGEAAVAVPLLVGHLYGAMGAGDHWLGTKAELQSHPLLARLRQDPYVRRAAEKPRGYAGDAELIDFLYDRTPPVGTAPDAEGLFKISTGFQASEGVRQRKQLAARFLAEAAARGHSVCALACGHLREAEGLGQAELARIVAVDQDSRSLARLRELHGPAVRVAQANAFGFLRQAASIGERFDYIYTLGLTDYLDDRAMALLHRLCAKLLTPGGTFRLANFLPGHLAVGWMDAVMDWQLIYRTEQQLLDFAREAGLAARSWTDPTGSIAWCEMTRS